jgi:hypothetical protein
MTTDLKNARATCKTIDAVCVGLIFAHITPIPYRGCLQEFASAMKLSPVAQYYQVDDLRCPMDRSQWNSFLPEVTTIEETQSEFTLMGTMFVFSLQQTSRTLRR